MATKQKKLANCQLIFLKPNVPREDCPIKNDLLSHIPNVGDVVRVIETRNFWGGETENMDWVVKNVSHTLYIQGGLGRSRIFTTIEFAPKHEFNNLI